jgi:hypothetical protein
MVIAFTPDISLDLTVVLPLILGLSGLVAVWRSELWDIFTKSFGRVSYYLQIAFQQLQNLIGSFVNSIISVIILIFSIIAIPYGLFVMIYVLLRPVGEAIDSLFIQIPPIAFLASLIQQEGYQGTLIGAFEGMLAEGLGLMVIVASIIFMAIGAAGIFIVIFWKEKMKLKTIFNISDIPESQTMTTPRQKEEDTTNSKKGGFK